MLGNGCDNVRAVDRKATESRVLIRLRERMMTPEISASAEAHRNQPLELHQSHKAIAEIGARYRKQGSWLRALSDRLTELEAKQDSLITPLRGTP